FICLEFVQNFFMSRICPEKISGIFHVQNLSSLFVQILSRFFSCLEYVQNLSGFLDMKNSRQSFFRTFSRHFLDMKKNSGQFPDNFDDIFRIFLFYREDEVKAFEWYDKSAEQGLSKAQYNLAKCYKN